MLAAGPVRTFFLNTPGKSASDKPRYVILNSEISGPYKVNRIISQTHVVEIPIFGSSRAQQCYIPDALGDNYFNYGLDGTRSDVMLFFLKEECKKQKNTPIILNFDLDGFESNIGDVSNYLYNADNAQVKELLGKHYSGIYAVPFVRYFGNFEQYVKYYLNNQLQLTRITNKGAAIAKESYPKKDFELMVSQRLHAEATFKNDGCLSAELLDLILHNPARRFIFVIAPIHSSYFSRFKNLDEAETYLSDLKKMSNIAVYNFSKVNYPDSLFVNTTHLNYQGAVRFNAQLKDSLAHILKP